MFGGSVSKEWLLEMIHLLWCKFLVEMSGDVVDKTEMELWWNENGCKWTCISTGLERIVQERVEFEGF